ncbi:aspartate kinase [Clostridium ihumii]|uniref:aspartate kinase n=1 Tax=Clostridium ihumii TaxID=1470356 RepID=UPI0005530EDF|nr:aspartate kinase [Clostridium ihumii]
MKILVQKFGGTSVSTEKNRKLVVKKVKNAISEGYSPVVVVSAMGRKGDNYATDTLLQLVSDDFKKSNLLATDVLLGCGEIISTVVMCNELYKEEIDSIPLTGGLAGIKTDSNYGSASILDVETNRILDLIKDGKVPVVAGFQGVENNGFLTTFGRGGSDVTGAILGAALKAEEVHIYTDVDGIMTADPRIVSDAMLIKQIGYEEVFQFADQGAKVIHPLAVEISKKYNIPLVIKNTLNDCIGTIISNDTCGESNKIITGITHVKGRVQITANYNGTDEYVNLLDILAQNNISIDLISVFPKQKIFTIADNDLEKFKDIVSKLNLSYSYIENCSKIAIIGTKMKGVPGVMARILKALTKQNIEVLQTADSHMTIWCLVEEKDTDIAINVLHGEFNLAH